MPILPTYFTGCRVSFTDYYDFMHVSVRDRFNFRIVPVTGDENCLIEHRLTLISVNESEHHSIRVSLIEHLNRVLMLVHFLVSRA